MVVLLEVAPISTKDPWSPAGVTIGSSVPSLTEVQLLHLAWWAALRRVLVCFKILSSKNHVGHFALGSLHCTRFFADSAGDFFKPDDLVFGQL